MLVSVLPRGFGLPPAIAVVSVHLFACNALWGIGDLRYDAAAGGSTTTSSAAGGGGAAGSGGDAGGPLGGGGAGGQGGSSCTFTPFHSPLPLAGIDTTYSNWDPAVSADELTVWFGGFRPGTVGLGDIWFASRPSIGADFSGVENAGAINSVDSEADPELSTDGLTLYWASERTDGVGDFDIWQATRLSVAASFAGEASAGPINTTAIERDPALSPDGLTLYFVSDRAGGEGAEDIWYATRLDASDPFDAPQLLSGVNSPDDDSNPAASPDGLTLYFASDRSGGLGASDIWYATRQDEDSDFGSPQPLASANSAVTDSDATLSADGLTLYFVTNRVPNSGGQLWTVVRECQ